MTRHCMICGREWDEQSAAYAQARETERRELADATRRSRWYVLATALAALLTNAFTAYVIWTKR